MIPIFSKCKNNHHQYIARIKFWYKPSNWIVSVEWYWKLLNAQGFIQLLQKP